MFNALIITNEMKEKVIQYFECLQSEIGVLRDRKKHQEFCENIEWKRSDGILTAFFLGITTDEEMEIIDKKLDPYIRSLHNGPIGMFKKKIEHTNDMAWYFSFGRSD